MVLKKSWTQLCIYQLSRQKIIEPHQAYDRANSLLANYSALGQHFLI
jgi:hypothetical protein